MYGIIDRLHSKDSEIVKSKPVSEFSNLNRAGLAKSTGLAQIGSGLALGNPKPSSSQLRKLKPKPNHQTI